MKKNFRLVFVALSSLIMLLGIGVTVYAAGVLYSLNEPSALTDEEEGIISRTADIVGAQAGINQWETEISTRQASLSEYLRVSFTGTSYLLTGKDDEAFSKDLSQAVYGSEDHASDILGMLSQTSRIYVIETLLAEISPTYASSDEGAIDEVGTQLSSILVDNPICNEEGYAFGIREISGDILINGSDARTDFYVDKDLRQGQLAITQDESGAQNFSMVWDTRSENAGTHQVTVLLRTSDGRGRIVTGGDVVIPSFFTLINDGVQQGSIASDQTDVWYALDAEDRNAYINFVDASGDICATLYDLHGNEIGKNDLPGVQNEVLRGAEQEIPASSNEEVAYQNIFYVRVQKGAENTSVDEITYLMIQSKEVAIDADGTYLSVVSDVGSVPTDIPTESLTDEQEDATVTCMDLNRNELTYAVSDLTFLPLNGCLASLDFTLVDDTPIAKYPSFSSETYSYGYVSETEIESILVKASTVEGYAASCKIECVKEDNSVSEASETGLVSLSQSANRVNIYVTDFDQNIHVYTLYLLSGKESSGYDVSTLSLFPSSYRSGLWLMHNLEPTYQFVPYYTNLSWDDLMSQEDNADRNLASDYSNPEWVKEDSPVYDGSSWRAAKTQVVSYFLDPRNFFDPVHIFMFEKLSFDSSIHTLDGVREMVDGTFLDATDPDYADILLRAGQESGVSPYFLTSRILQEMGVNAESELATGTLPGYEGYYNFYNIGSTPDPDVENGARINGAKYAMYGSDPDAKTITADESAILLPWTTPDLAIRGGALWIAKSYISIGQDTLYFQKFDVISNDDGLYQHQYAQNISMPYTEGVRYHDAYLAQNMISTDFIFVIPVYYDIPETWGELPEE